MEGQNLGAQLIFHLSLSGLSDNSDGKPQSFENSREANQPLVILCSRFI